MQVRRAVLEQWVAVFGENGSGKTVLLWAFYGAAQEPTFLQNSRFRVVSEDIGQGARLHRNHLGVRDSARLPTQTWLAATANAFSVKLKSPSDGRAAKSPPFNALRLILHDYPGVTAHKLKAIDENARAKNNQLTKILSGFELGLTAGESERILLRSQQWAWTTCRSSG